MTILILSFFPEYRIQNCDGKSKRGRFLGRIFGSGGTFSCRRRQHQLVERFIHIELHVHDINTKEETFLLPSFTEEFQRRNLHLFP